MKKTIFLLVILLMVSAVSAVDIWDLDQAERSKLVRENLDNVNLDDVPGVLKFLLGKPKINIQVNGETYGFRIVKNEIEDFVEGGLEDPNYIVFTSEEVLNEIVNAEDVPGTVEAAYLRGRITVEPQTVGAKVKFWFAKRFLKWFGPEAGDCDDSDSCTIDTFNDETGLCEHVAIDCDDQDPCTDDACDQGRCAHVQKNCSDGDANTQDMCDPTGACIHQMGSTILNGTIITNTNQMDQMMEVVFSQADNIANTFQFGIVLDSQAQAKDFSADVGFGIGQGVPYNITYRWVSGNKIVLIDSVVQGQDIIDAPVSLGDGTRGTQREISFVFRLLGEYCGNGVVDPGEMCDDGNADDNDGCSQCMVLRVVLCGNGVVDSGELCDDGNLIGGDGCSSKCQTEVCGNGVVDPGEYCDDGNDDDNDGCTTTCHIQRIMLCGNGVVDRGEQCDDGNTDDTDGCTTWCAVQRLTVCGNGYTEYDEQCDDGNLVPGDGCSPQCVLEVCGNGVVDPGEACDDGNKDDSDGCTTQCHLYRLTV